MEFSGQVVPTNKATKKKKNKKMILIEEGNHIDVKSVLSSKNRNYLLSPKDGKIVPVSSLEGKYVLICCFLIPFDLDLSTEASLCQSLQALYSHLSDIAISDFVKLVIVLKLEQNATAVAFDSFFSWFPLNCLTVPFWDSQSRHYVCRALHLSPNFTRQSRHLCLAVHPSGLVLLSDPSFLQYYGARSFPFTRTHLQDINRYDDSISRATCSNDSIVILKELQCDSLSQIAEVDTKSVRFSDLFDAPVGLYLYVDGFFMAELRVLHKSCRDKGLKFDVVVVPVPFVENYDPASFCDRMKQSALEDEISSSWLLFPFDDNICRTLWRLTCNDYKDALIILPHGDFCGDLDGRAVAINYGIDAYPFTKDAVIKQKVNHLRSLTLDCLLGEDFTDVWDLRNKNILLCFDCSYSPTYKVLKDEYCKIKSEYPDCKVVFVDREDPRFSNAYAEIEWPILPAEKHEAVIKHIFTDWPVLSTTLCAFGKDGKLLSRSAWRCLPIRKSSDPLFRDTLYTEILVDVEEELEIYMY